MEKIIALASDLLGKKVELVERLLGGMSNYTYIIQADNKKYTFRLPGEKAEQFVSRNIEKQILSIVEPLGITNHTVYLDLETGVKIAEYVEGKVLSTLDRQLYLKQVSDTLKVMHQSGIKAINDYDPVGRLDKYEKINDGLNPRYVELKNIWLSLYETYKKLPLVLCHGDAQPSNFIITGERALVVDFEFSGNNDPFYDLACFGNIDFNDAKALLDVYVGHKATKEELKRLIFNRFFQTLQWHQVATYKHKIGLSDKLHIPFDQVALAYLDKATKLYQDYQEV